MSYVIRILVICKLAAQRPQFFVGLLVIVSAYVASMYICLQCLYLKYHLLQLRFYSFNLTLGWCWTVLYVHIVFRTYTTFNCPKTSVKLSRAAKILLHKGNNPIDQNYLYTPHFGLETLVVDITPELSRLSLGAHLKSDKAITSMYRLCRNTHWEKWSARVKRY